MRAIATRARADSRRRAAVLAVAALLLPPACSHNGSPPAPPPPIPPPAAPTQAVAKPALLTSADVDARLRSEWARTGVVPAAPADDATWLRRAWIDLLGTIPPPEVTRRFLVDRSPEKRARAIDEMLASPLWADHWTSYWDEVLMGLGTRAPDVDRGAFRAFLHAAFSRNAPWSEIVTQLLTATGRNSAGGPQREAYTDRGETGEAEGVNGAVNWTLRYQATPQDMAGAAARTLLAVQIQCAQCHDHKTEKWTQKDFQSFAASFARTRLVPVDAGKPMGQVRRVEVSELDRPAPRFAKMGDLEALSAARPRALDGTDLAGDPRSVREALARWITAPDNPWFSRAFVNRTWGHLMGRGFVDPVDDLRPSNPPAAPELYDALAADFAASGWDVKHLVRIVAGSEAYGLSAAALPEATAKIDPEAKLWERFRVTPLGPDELLNALIAATRLDAIVRATGRLDLDQVRARVQQRYGFLFDVDEDADTSDYEGTISQALALLNGGVTAAGASVLPGSALADVMAMPGDDAARFDELALRVLSRVPSPEERDRWVKLVADAQRSPAPVAAPAGSKKSAAANKATPRAPDPLRGLENRVATEQGGVRVRAFEDVLWAMLNSSEFVFNH
jgi:hypothetical protein